jgi:three-Cys-motif partner protein
MTDDFFDRVRDWSHWKHVILEKYLQIWVYKLSSRRDHLVFIDTCAGEGLYASGEEGSPVIAAKWNDAYLRAKGKRLLVIAFEADPEAAPRLYAAMEPWASRTPPDAVVIEESFVSRLPWLLEQTRHVPTFVFIDPFGMRSIRADEIMPLLKDEKREPTELLMRVDPGLLKRFAGWLRPKERDERGMRTAASFKKTLERCNIRIETLEALAAEVPELAASPSDVDLLGEYLEMVKKRFKYVQLIPIRPKYFAAPKYFLVHGTDSEHGAAAINDAVSTTEDDLYVDSERRAIESTGQRSLFDPAPEHRVVRHDRRARVSISDAAAEIVSLLRKRGAMTFIELRAELAMRFGPDLREKHHKQALRTVIERGDLEPLPDGKISDNSLVRLRV